MNTKSYSKFKDCTPEDTIALICDILHSIGISTSYEWVQNEYENCYSNRVSLYPTHLGTNGKGTDRMYALASGYGELMERIENNIFFSGQLSPEDAAYGGYYRFPDQVLLPFSELMEGNPFMDAFFGRLGCEDDTSKRRVLREFANRSPETEQERLCIPYADIDQGGVVYLPLSIIRSVYGSNGMAAGNTMEEALVQALSEIMERYVNEKIALEHICPPSVPEHILEQVPSLMRIIRDIEKDPRYKVVIKDCSLGRGLPVVAAVIQNRSKGTFGVKFASHPSFSVALERTLTEAFQGKKLEKFSTDNRVGSDAQVRHRYNLQNIMKIGYGVYPKEILIGEPDYPFGSFYPSETKSNTQMVVALMELIRKEGYSVLIHDSSYLGFPSYHVLVPGMSEVYPMDELRIRDINTCGKAADSITHMHRFTDEEAKRIIRLITYKETSAVENQIEALVGRPFTDRLPGGSMAAIFLKAVCLYQTGEYERASSELKRVSDHFEKRGSQKEQQFYRCIQHYVSFCTMGISNEECGQLIRELFEPEVADRVSECLADPAHAIEMLYPSISCYDCAHCRMAQEGCCQYPQVSEIIRKIKDGMSGHIPDQKKLLSDVRSMVYGKTQD